MAESYSIGEAKTNLSKLVALAEQGERVELRRGQEPVAALVAIKREGASRRSPGAMAGEIRIAKDFDRLPSDVEKALGVSEE